MSDVTETLTQRVGPLPLWGYGVAIGGAIVAWRVLRGGSIGGGSSSGSSNPADSATVPATQFTQQGTGTVGTPPPDTTAAELTALEKAVAALTTQVDKLNLPKPPIAPGKPLPVVGGTKPSPTGTPAAKPPIVSKSKTGITAPHVATNTAVTHKASPVAPVGSTTAHAGKTADDKILPTATVTTRKVGPGRYES